MVTHGYGSRRRRTPTYRAWESMKRRCNNPKEKNYENYGGRGIKVCRRWVKFVNFLEDMGECPDGLTLERINVNKGYSKNNCCWATRKQQVMNRRCARLVTYQGLTKPLEDWAKEFSLNYQTLWQRLERGWTVERSLLQKPRNKIDKVKYLIYDS